MRLASIHLYPVKSLGGVDVPEAAVEPWGLRGDRRWLALNPDGTYLTARTAPRMLGITAVPRPDGGLDLTGLDGTVLHVDPPHGGQPAPTSMTRLDRVRLAGADAHGWLSAQLGQPLRLGWLDDPGRRSVALDHGGQPGDLLNLSDAGPVLLASTASLRLLNDWIAQGAVERGEDLPEPLPMARFRPSVVVDGAVEPFAEDGWQRVRIGDTLFRFAEQCDRCALTLIDTTTFTSGREPIRTLARHRARDGKTWFAVRLVPVGGPSLIRVGDPVTVD
ncbi:molybdenum cofactor biosysynthesis protein [Catellatospora sp. TT07R-123]|uniref:MOSC domain-containing protein n=1 Tax=Catellatospora sp. TT07R-123 TaxID=2733863 RepID=UPI001B2DE3C4|nr:MOSC N-terminal beta barrel domain-containing protein [Catellatospora sp. TT07R-123]GHJ46888.1 molybdenum cofactor biosysynthesis protein [Catellatospora sp. TT07R-123]